MDRRTIRLTMAQALVKWLTVQMTEIDGARVPLFGGVFGIFGHGNVTCLSEALEAVQDTLPTWRGQNEQSMALAAIGLRQGQASSADHDRHLLDRAGCAEHGDGCRHGPCKPAAGPADRRGHVHQPRARSGDAAGRTLRQSDHHGERCLQGRDALLGPDHAPRADHPVAAAGRGRDAGPRRLRPGLPCAAAGHPGTCLRLSGGILRGTALVHSPPAPRPQGCQKPPLPFCGRPRSP